MARIDEVIQRGVIVAWIVVAETRIERKVAKDYGLEVGKAIDKADAENIKDRIVSYSASVSS